MADYIERGTGVSIFRAKANMAVLSDAAPYFEKAAQMLEKLPAADVAPVVHGRWMYEKTEGGFHIWRCSRCGRGMNDNPEGIDLYCYHCGAKMDGGDSNEAD